MFLKHQLYYDRYNLILNLYSTCDVTINIAVCICHDLVATEKLSFKLFNLIFSPKSANDCFLFMLLINN